MFGAGAGSLSRVSLFSVKAYFFAGWRDALAWPIFGWLSPEEPVRLIRPDETEVLLMCKRSAWVEVKGRKAAITAIELPEAMVLNRSISLPTLPDAELQRVVSQEVAKSSPFTADNTVYGYQDERIDDSRLCVECAIAARDQVMAYLADKASLVGKHPPEVWGPGKSGLAFHGFGEDRRERRLKLRRRSVFALLLAAAGFGFAILATPTMQLRLRAVQATAAYEKLQKVSAPQLRLREEFQNSGARLDEASKLLEMPVEPLKLIEDLSKLLSDDEWVSELRIRGNAVQISGEGANASKLLQTLGEQPDYKEVKATAASVKNGNRESYSFEFKVVPASEEAK